jgi:hypothetical protein
VPKKFLLCIVLGLWSIASAAFAQTVVLLRPEAGDSELLDLYHRLSGELSSHQFVTLEVNLSALSGMSLARMALERDAVAALAPERDGGAITLRMWLVDSLGQGQERRIAAEPSDDTASLIALRAVDLLRVSLTEPEPEPEPASQPQPQPTAAERPPRAGPPKFWLGASGLMLRAGERFGFGFGPLLGLFYRATPWLHVGLQLAGPITGARLTTSSGDAIMYQELAWFEARAIVLRAGGLQVAPLIGVGAYFVQAQGAARAPLTSQNDQVWSGLLSAGGYIDYALSPRVALTGAVRALALVPRTGVAVFRESALIELPALEASLGIALGL